MAAAPRPTKSELAILRVLWERGPLSVRAVQSVLDAAKPTGYTTVLKLMQDGQGSARARRRRHDLIRTSLSPTRMAHRSSQCSSSWVCA
jgi:hypothetical protein